MTMLVIDRAKSRIHHLGKGHHGFLYEPCAMAIVRLPLPSRLIFGFACFSIYGLLHSFEASCCVSNCLDKVRGRGCFHDGSFEAETA